MQQRRLHCYQGWCCGWISGVGTELMVQRVVCVEQVERVEWVEQVEQVEWMDQMERVEQVKWVDQIERVGHLEWVEQVKWVETGGWRVQQIVWVMYIE